MNNDNSHEFRLSAKQYTLLAVVGLAFVAIGVSVLDGEDTLKTLAGILFFGWIGGHYAYQAWRRPVRLIVDPSGITPGNRDEAPVPWARVEHITVRRKKVGKLRMRHVLIRESGFVQRQQHEGAISRIGRKVFRLDYDHSVNIGELSAPVDEIVASIERFHPVVREDE